MQANNLTRLMDIILLNLLTYPKINVDKCSKLNCKNIKLKCRIKRLWCDLSMITYHEADRKKHFRIFITNNVASKTWNQ